MVESTCQRELVPLRGENKFARENKFEPCPVIKEDSGTFSKFPYSAVYRTCTVAS